MSIFSLLFVGIHPYPVHATGSAPNPDPATEFVPIDKKLKCNSSPCNGKNKSLGSLTNIAGEDKGGSFEQADKEGENRLWSWVFMLATAAIAPSLVIGCPRIDTIIFTGITAGWLVAEIAFFGAYKHKRDKYLREMEADKDQNKHQTALLSSYRNSLDGIQLAKDKALVAKIASIALIALGAITLSLSIICTIPGFGSWACFFFRNTMSWFWHGKQ